MTDTRPRLVAAYANLAVTARQLVNARMAGRFVHRHASAAGVWPVESTASRDLPAVCSRAVPRIAPSLARYWSPRRYRVIMSTSSLSNDSTGMVCGSAMSLCVFVSTVKTISSAAVPRSRTRTSG